MKISSLLIFILLVFGCQDEITQPSTKIITRPGITPSPDPESLPSKFKFSGISSFTNITRTSVEVNWKHVSGFYSYSIISVSNNERKIIQAVKAPNESIKLSNLVPDTAYTLLIRAMDNSGYTDLNTKTLSFKTLPWPNFINRYSLRFNGSKSISLGASNKLGISKKFTTSMWIKTDTAATHETHLLTLHSELFAATSLSIGLEGQMVQIGYRNNNSDTLQYAKTQFEYYNNRWHHISLSANGTTILLYIDGVEKLKVYSSLAIFGTHPARVGSFTGIQKGFTGKIDEVAIFKEGFNQVEMIELYNRGQAIDFRAHSNNKNLVHWYQLGDQLGDSEVKIEDVIGNIDGVPLNFLKSDFTADAP